MPLGRKGAAKGGRQQQEHNKATLSSTGKSGGEREVDTGGGGVGENGLTIHSHPSLPDLPQPMGELFYECTLFLYSAFALFSMYVNLYKALWWIPKAHLNYYAKLHLIDPYVLSCVGLILGRRVTWCFLRNIPVFVPDEGETLPFWFQLLEWIIKLPMLGVVLSSFMINFIRVLTTHAWASLIWLFYPVFVAHVVLFNKEILSVFNTKEGLGDLFRRMCDYVRGHPVLLDVNLRHACSSSPAHIRHESDLVMQDVYQRIKQSIFSGFTVAYFGIYVPCSFAPKTLYIDKWWIAELCFLVFFTSFCMYMTYLIPLQYCNLLHQAASHLGEWKKLKPQTPHPPYQPWSESQLWPEGSIVQYGRSLYKAEGDQVAATPGNLDHSRLYRLASDPIRLLNYLCIFQGFLILIVFFFLVHSTEWQHIFTLVALIPANYIILFFLFKDKVILGRIYNPSPEDEALAKG